MLDGPRTFQWLINILSGQLIIEEIFILVESFEVESLSFDGKLLNSHSRWRRTFELDFAKQLLIKLQKRN